MSLDFPQRSDKGYAVPCTSTSMDPSIYLCIYLHSKIPILNSQSTIGLVMCVTVDVNSSIVCLYIDSTSLPLSPLDVNNLWNCNITIQRQTTQPFHFSSFSLRRPNPNIQCDILHWKLEYLKIDIPIILYRSKQFFQDSEFMIC